MAEFFGGNIWIGGTVTRETLKGLIEALHRDGASDDYGGCAIEADCLEWDDLAQYLDDQSLLHLENEQAHNGEFQATEAFCMKHGIPFDRNSDHYHEYDAEMVYWRPGMNNPVIRYADSHGDEIIAASPVRQAIVEFEAMSAAGASGAAYERCEAGMKLLRDACHELPPTLEKFEII